MAYFRPGHMSDHAKHTLQELCLFKIVDNLDLLGDVGDTPAIFLERIFAHCTLDQLKRIEDASNERNLEDTTNEFWQRFYQKKWGADAAGAIEGRVVGKGLPLRWRALYEHKVKQEEQVQARCVSRLRELFIKERNDKQSRTVQVCARRPEAKRKVGGPQSAAAPAQRGRLLAKAKKEFVGSFDALRRKTQLHTAKSPQGNRPHPVSPTSAGPVQKRPAPSSHQNPVWPHPTGQSTRPQAQDTKGAHERSVLGKRLVADRSGSSTFTSTAQKRLALGSPESEVRLRNVAGLGRADGSRQEEEGRQKVHVRERPSESSGSGKFTRKGEERSQKKGDDSEVLAFSKGRHADDVRYRGPTSRGETSSSGQLECKALSQDPKEGPIDKTDGNLSTQSRSSAVAGHSKKRHYETLRNQPSSDSLRKKSKVDLVEVWTNVQSKARKTAGTLADDDLWGDDL